MSIVDFNWDRIKHCLKDYPVEFCLLYKKSGTDSDKEQLSLFKAYFLKSETEQSPELLSNKYLALAQHCHLHSENRILREGLRTSEIETTEWCGLALLTKGQAARPPINSLGQRWWHMVVGGGQMAKLGLVLVVRVGVKETEELEILLRKIEHSIHGDDPSRSS